MISSTDTLVFDVERRARSSLVGGYCDGHRLVEGDDDSRAGSLRLIMYTVDA